MAPAGSDIPAAGDPVPRNSETLPPGLIAAEPETREQPVFPPADAEEPDAARYERDEKITTTRFHIVRQGENLSAISQQYYNSPNKWRKILEANQEPLKDPNKIAPGMKLIIPE